MQICSGSMFSSSIRASTPRGLSLRFVARRSIAFRSPGQHLSPHWCLEHDLRDLQMRKHWGGSSCPWWHKVSRVLRPQRQVIGTVNRQGGHESDIKIHAVEKIVFVHSRGVKGFWWRSKTLGGEKTFAERKLSPYPHRTALTLHLTTRVREGE